VDSTIDEINLDTRSDVIENSRSSIMPSVNSNFQSVSQKDYEPTPYKQTAWEGSDSFDKNPIFEGMSLEVLQNEEFKRDPMFEVFDEPLNVSEFRQFPKEIPPEEEPGFGISEVELEEIRLQAFEEGRTRGKEEGAAAAQVEIFAKYEELANTMREVSNHITSEVDRRVNVLEQNALGLALDISKKILDTTAEVKKDYIKSLIKKSLIQLGAASNIIVKVGSADFEFLSVVGLPEAMEDESAKIRYVMDENITSGCIIESDHGELNLELDKMWQEVKDRLYEAVES